MCAHMHTIAVLLISAQHMYSLGLSHPEGCIIGEALFFLSATVWHDAYKIKDISINYWRTKLQIMHIHNEFISFLYKISCMIQHLLLSIVLLVPATKPQQFNDVSWFKLNWFWEKIYLSFKIVSIWCLSEFVKWWAITYIHMQSCACLIGLRFR